MISPEIGTEFKTVERSAKRQRTSPTIWTPNNTTTPVVVESRMNTIEFSNFLRENLGESLKEIRPLRSGTGYLVFAKTNRVKNELLKGLPGMKVREPETRYNEHQFVILGVNRAIDTKAIEDELKKKNVSFSKVIRITSRTTNQPTPLVRVFTKDKETYERALSDGITLGFQKFKCEKPREKPIEVQQCFKCNKFNHIAKECNNETACSKCRGKHDRKECQANTKKCSNCGECHPSTYKGCKTRTELIQEKQANKKKAAIEKLPAPRAEVEQKINEVKVKCDQDWKTIKNIICYYVQNALTYVKDNVPGTTLTNTNIGQFMDKMLFETRLLEAFDTPSFRSVPNAQS